ncbi:hypothetical protein ACS0TY_029460 [Phlomoides rotata]
MANRPTYSQDRYFYSSTWSKEETVFLIEGLALEKNAGRWAWNGQNIDAIMSVKDRLNEEFNRNVTVQSIFQRICILRIQYRIFDKLVHQSDVHWDQDENVVYASLVTWDILRQEYPLTNAYLYQGDPLYDSLKIIFKPDGNESDDEPDDIPVIINAQPNLNNAGTYAPTTSNTRHSMVPNRASQPNNTILNFYNDDSDSSTSTFSMSNRAFFREFKKISRQ